ncbi:hypothetical protein [Methylobacterium pseudosasicola]|uniref:Uncharacterized protein n=1 Tax=Methylobacterium pseudosasicola TaxID=582667 RepID=A0A1I4UUX4_9HYPH|nr:hypothetical protein [Methylobacterium pseudosasicola]SFM92685.1 hypothetical protein SAMN05192568_10789 [Methylobacterium pseudosasicola]
MTAEPASPERLSEVLRLCTVLSDRALDALITGGAVPADQAVALAKAARLLQDYDVEWPPLLTHVMHELADKDGRSVPEPAGEASEGVDLHGLTRFFASFRKDKEQQ